jgi:hypothetical protein
VGREEGKEGGRDLCSLRQPSSQSGLKPTEGVSY